MSSASIQREEAAAVLTQGHSHPRLLKISLSAIFESLVALSQCPTLAFTSSLKILPDCLPCTCCFFLRQNSDPWGRVHPGDTQTERAWIAPGRGAPPPLPPNNHPRWWAQNQLRVLPRDAGGKGHEREFLAREPGLRFGACIFTSAPKENGQTAVNTSSVWKMAHRGQ